MSVTVSSKYQVVIPKAVRRQLNIKPGQQLYVESTDPNSVTMKKTVSAEELVEKCAGTLKGTTWQKAGVDATKWIRKMRDEEWN